MTNTPYATFVGPLGDDLSDPSHALGTPPLQSLSRSARATATPATAVSEAVYCVVGLVPAITFFVLVVTLLSVGLGLAVIWVGLPILVLGLLIARLGALVQLGLIAGLLGSPLPAPARIARRHPGGFGWIRSVLADPVSWRAVAYQFVRIVLAPVQFSVAIAFYVAGLAGVTYWYWRPWLPAQQASDGSWHRGAEWFPDSFLDTWPRLVLVAAIGILLLAISPKVVRTLTDADRALAAHLLTDR